MAVQSWVWQTIVMSMRVVGAILALGMAVGVLAYGSSIYLELKRKGEV